MFEFHLYAVVYSQPIGAEDTTRVSCFLESNQKRNSSFQDVSIQLSTRMSREVCKLLGSVSYNPNILHL